MEVSLGRVYKFFNPLVAPPYELVQLISYFGIEGVMSDYGMSVLDT